MKKLAPIVPITILWLGYWGFYTLLGHQSAHEVWWSIPYMLTGAVSLIVSTWWAGAVVFDNKGWWP